MNLRLVTGAPPTRAEVRAADGGSGISFDQLQWPEGDAGDSS
ncbi:MAG: hypothetical protein RXN87_01870 [Acidilobus sp.]